jgi:hypothetical protein
MPPRLSAVDAINPALQRMQEILFRPFRFATWLKIGFIGWLAGEGVNWSFNYSTRGPSIPGTQGENPLPMIREWIMGHLGVIVLAVAFALLLALLFAYISCRFRFILLDAVLTRDPQIGRAWRRYGAGANRFFVFWVIFLLATWTALFFIVVRPLWRAFKSGVFSSHDPWAAILSLILTLFLGLLVFGIVYAVISTLANDFLLPIIALEDQSAGGAWSYLADMVSSEPWAFAGYLGMKLVLVMAAGLASAIVFLVCLLVLALPVLAIVLVGALIVTALKSLGPVGAAFAVVLIGIFVLVGAALVIVLSMLATAPFAVFFTSYSLYFLGGRLPSLGAILWPAPPPVVLPPMPPTGPSPS